jgi:hypothetical protein
VNILLLLLYAASVRVGLDTTDIHRLEQCSGPWREAVVEPLRAVRRKIKGYENPAFSTLYSQLKDAELEAERQAQHRLYGELSKLRKAPTPMGVLELARSNLLGYQATLPLREEAVQALLHGFAQYLQIAAGSTTDQQ